MFDYIDVFFALLAGVIFTIAMIALDIPFDVWVLNLIIIMILMLSTGFIYKKYIKVLLAKKDEEQNNELEQKNEDSENNLLDDENSDEVLNNAFDDYDDEDEEI